MIEENSQHQSMIQPVLTYNSFFSERDVEIRDDRLGIDSSATTQCGRTPSEGDLLPLL